MKRESPTSNDIYKAIAHGDAAHRAWLKEALDALFAGRPVPPPNRQRVQWKIVAPVIVGMTIGWLIGSAIAHALGL
jgi:hypothetical protein